MPIPELSEEERSKLVRELIQYLDNKHRIWNGITPAARVAELIRGIIMGKSCAFCSHDWLAQELKKMPPLWKRVEPYYYKH